MPGLLKVRVAIFSTFVTVCASSSVGVVCGDCNSDGEVTVDEIVTSVNYALNGSSPGRATPFGDRCSESQPGQRIEFAGHEWVIVEVPVTLEGATERFILRHPVRVNKGGLESKISKVTSQHLTRVCTPSDFSCLHDERSICGFPCFVKTNVDFGRVEYSELEPGFPIQQPVLNVFAKVRVEAAIVVNPNYSPVQIVFEFDEKQERRSSLRLSDMFYSLVHLFDMNLYSKPNLERARREMEELMNYISLLRR